MLSQICDFWSLSVSALLELAMVKVVIHYINEKSHNANFLALIRSCDTVYLVVIIYNPSGGSKMGLVASIFRHFKH